MSKLEPREEGTIHPSITGLSRRDGVHSLVEGDMVIDVANAPANAALCLLGSRKLRQDRAWESGAGQQQRRGECVWVGGHQWSRTAGEKPRTQRKLRFS